MTQGFQNIPGIRTNRPPENIQHAYYKYDVFVRPERLKHGWDRDHIMTAINARGIPCFSGSCSEVYLEKAFDVDGLRPAKRLPVAQDLGKTGLTFLVHPTLTDDDMMEVCDVVESVMQKATTMDAISDSNRNITNSLDEGLLQ